ncbi:MAG: hypothetical protein WCF19_02940 [Chlamydiales bacterium]
MTVAAAQSVSLPVSLQIEPSPNSVILKVALPCLKELAVALCIGLAVSFFVAPAEAPILIVAAVIQLIANAFFRFVQAFALPKTPFEWIGSLSEWMTGLNFAVLTGYNAQHLIHESGHAMASMLMYKKAQPWIQIYPFTGGLTEFSKTGLTALGKKLGSSAVTCLMVASGPGLTLLLSAILLSIGLSIKEQYPQLGKTLISWALIDFLGHAHYAYSALKADPWNLSHDFVHLSIFGLHPMTATIGIIAIPIVILLGHVKNRIGF